MNPFIHKAANSLPGYSQVLSDDVSQWKTWSKGWYVEDDYRFERTPYRFHTSFQQARGQQHRALVDSLKCGAGVFVRCPQTGKRDIAAGRYIGKKLWQRVVKARGRRPDYDKQMTRAEVMYVSQFPEADLRGKELHHINMGRTHLLWKMQIQARLAGARLRGVESLDSLILTLDDRPRNLIALTPREHYLIHLLEKTPYYGNFVRDALDEHVLVEAMEVFKKVRLAMFWGQTNIIPNQVISTIAPARYDKKGLRGLTMVNRRFKVMHVISDRILSRSRRYGLRSA